MENVSNWAPFSVLEWMGGGVEEEPQNVLCKVW